MQRILIISEDQDDLERIVDSLETIQASLRCCRPNESCPNLFTIVLRKYKKDGVKYGLYPFYYGGNFLHTEQFCEYMQNVAGDYDKIIFFTHAKDVNSYGGRDGEVIENIQRVFVGKEIKLISIHESFDDKRKQIRDFCC